MHRIALVVVLVGVARVAAATGVCENTGVRYDPPELFDEKTQSFAIPAKQEWCDEIQDGGTLDEKRGAVSFVELRDVTGKVLGILSTATGDDAKRLEAARGSFEAVPLGKLHKLLLSRGYAPLASKLKQCKLAGAWTDVAPGGGWRAATLALDVMAGTKRILRVKLGEGSIARRGDQQLRAHVMPGRKAIAVFATVPSCEGPPPGYFGPEDGGDCYHVDAPVTLLLSDPALAACL